MDERITKLKTPEECEKFAKNATRLNRPDLALEARRRAIEIRSEKYAAKSKIEKEAIKAIYAYEDILAEKNGRKTKATRTWQMIDRHGIIEAINRVVARRDDAMGYIMLKERGMEDLSFEAVVLRHPDMFSQEAVQHAQARIEKHT